MIYFFAVPLGLFVTWLLVGTILRTRYEFYVGYQMSQFEGRSVNMEERTAQRDRMFECVKKVVDNKWFFNNAQVAEWFYSYCKRFDPERKQKQTAELQHYIFDHRPKIRKIILGK